MWSCLSLPDNVVQELPLISPDKTTRVNVAMIHDYVHIIILRLLLCVCACVIQAGGDWKPFDPRPKKSFFLGISGRGRYCRYNREPTDTASYGPSHD